MGKHSKASNNRTKEVTPQPEDTPKMTQPIAGDNAGGLEGYTLNAIAKGFQRYDSRWAHPASDIVIRFSLLDNEGGKANEHPVLSVGSAIDTLHSLLVIYRKGGEFASMKAVRIDSDASKGVWYVVGINRKGEVRELSPLMVKGKTESGEDTFIPYDCKSKQYNRMVVRDLCNHLTRLVLAPDKDTSEVPTLVKLEREQITLNAKIQKIAVSLKRINPTEAAELYANQLSILDESMKLLVTCEGRIDKIRESLKNPAPEVDITELLAQARERVTEVK